jgi:hypothetical protein
VTRSVPNALRATLDTSASVIIINGLISNTFSNPPYRTENEVAFDDIRAYLYDPWQSIALAQKLNKLGVPMHEYRQSVGNLTTMAGTLGDLIKTRRLSMYRSRGLRQSAANAIVIESSRGMRIGKAKASHKVDLIGKTICPALVPQSKLAQS